MQPSQPCTTPMTIAINSLTFGVQRPGGHRGSAEVVEGLVDTRDHLPQFPMLGTQVIEDLMVVAAF